MNKSALVPVLAVVASFAASDSASAAWTKPGKCRIPASQRSTFDQLDSANNRFSTQKVACYIAAFTIEDMLRGGRWTRSSFRHTSMGARWIVRLSCRSRLAPESGTPQRGRVITCLVRRGEDAETKRGTVRNMARGSIKWTTAYTG